MSDSPQRTAAEQRRVDVLRAIVEHYVATHEPVGSKAVAQGYELGVSPATIRNDMAVLEDEGYLAQPHTSAGRVPTDKGYRLFVDQLATVKPMSPSERRAVELFIGGGVDLDDVIVRASQLLAQLTGQVAVVQYPSLRRSGLRHVELVPLSTERLLVVIITDTGRVEQRTVELTEAIDPGALANLRVVLNVAAAGRRLPDLVAAFEHVVRESLESHQQVAQQIAELIVDTISEEREERMVLSGAANLAAAQMGFEENLGPVLEALEEQVVLLKLLTEMAAETSPVSVRIGRETRVDGLVNASVVTSGYGQGSDLVATISSIGPTRMDYPATIASVRAVARYLSRIVTT